MRKTGSITYKLTSLVVSLALTLSVAGCAGSNPQTSSPPVNVAADAQQYDLVFAVAGDSRAGKPGQTDFWIDPSKKPDYKKYINTAVLGALRENLIKIWKGSPGFFLMHLGDIGMRGGTPIFNAFKQEMDPLINAGIPVYLTIGNHELRYYKAENNGKKEGQAESAANTYEAQKEYKVTIGSSMIPNGAEIFSPHYTGGLAYSFKKGNSLFIALDAYYVNYDDPKNPKYKKGYYSDFQLDKLREILVKNQGMQNIFVFSHQPAFNAADGEGNFYNNYNTTDANRSDWILWALLDTYKVDAYFCGHSHFYHRWNVIGPKFGNEWDTPTKWRAVSSDFPHLQTFVKYYKDKYYSSENGTTDWQNEIPQIVNGTCGAPPQGFGKGHAGVPQVPAQKRASVYNYSIVMVKGETITVDVYSYDETTPTQTQPKLIDKFQKQGDQWQTIPLNLIGVMEDETGAMEDQTGSVEDESEIDEGESVAEEDASGA